MKRHPHWIIAHANLAIIIGLGMMALKGLGELPSMPWALPLWFIGGPIVLVFGQGFFGSGQ